MIEIPSIVSWILQNFSDLLPAKMVFEYERGVKFKKGKAVRKDLQSGLHWYLPIRDKIEKVAVREQVDLLESQSLTTADGKAVVLRFSIRYSIWSAWRFWVKIHDGYDSLYAATLGYIADAVTSATWDQLMESRSALGEEVVIKLKPRVHPWGFVAHEVTITELVEAGHYRIFGEQRILPTS